MTFDLIDYYEEKRREALYERYTKDLGIELPGQEPRRFEHHGAPRCRCGSRNTTRIGESALLRQCNACSQTYRYLLKDGLLIPTALETALALEGK